GQTGGAAPSRGRAGPSSTARRTVVIKSSRAAGISAGAAGRRASAKSAPMRSRITRTRSSSPSSSSTTEAGFSTPSSFGAERRELKRLAPRTRRRIGGELGRERRVAALAGVALDLDGEHVRARAQERGIEQEVDQDRAHR